MIRSLGRGRYSDCFKVKDASGHAVACKLSYYQEATIKAFARLVRLGDRHAACLAKDQDAISVSAGMAEVAKLMKTLRVSPHFVRVYCEADVKHLPLRLKPLLRHRLPRLTPNQLKYSHVCIMEVCLCNLTTYLTRYVVADATLKELLFQVIYTLACLQSVLPGFRHNDLSTNNVLVKRAKHGPTRYHMNGMVFLTQGPVAAVLADFDFTHVPGHEVLSNERVLGGKYGIAPAPNNAYDTHLLLQSTARCLKRSHQCGHTLGFLRSIGLDPSHDRLAFAKPHLSPASLLAHPYFASLRDPAPSMPCPETYAVT